MTAVLHIGLPKTGSTYLQEWLRLNCDTLRSGGVHVVPSSFTHRLGTEGFESRTDAARTDVQSINNSCSLSAVLDQLRATRGRKVIASEYLSEIRPEHLAELLEAAKITVTGVICYLRRQDHICSSGYSQGVKTLGHSERIGKVVYTDRLNWHLLYEGWQAAFQRADVRFHSYERCVAETSLLRRFKDALGVGNLVTEDPIEYLNLSLSAEMTEVARHLNERGQVFDADCLLQMQDGRTCVPFGFSSKTTREFEELFIESNRELASLLPDEFSSYALPGWRSKGEDLTDHVGPERMAEIMLEYSRLKHDLPNIAHDLS